MVSNEKLIRQGNAGVSPASSLGVPPGNTHDFMASCYVYEIH